MKEYDEYATLMKHRYSLCSL